MALKPQDVFVLLELVTQDGRPGTYQSLGAELGMSASEVHQAIRRSLDSRLAARTDAGVVPLRTPLLEFLSHGVQYAFPPEIGRPTRGMPTSVGAPPLDRHFARSDTPPVWPDPRGTARGPSFSPLYRSVPQAARADRALYELLALVDAIRGGQAREHKLACKELTERLKRSE